jgi:hypothetical protein
MVLAATAATVERGREASLAFAAGVSRATAGVGGHVAAGDPSAEEVSHGSR